MMLEHSLDPYSLAEDAWLRRDKEATPEQQEDMRRLEHTFRHTRILVARSRLKAEAYLQQN